MPNLIELSRRLHQERLFTKHEQDAIWKLNKQVQSHAEQVSHLFWITRQHYLNLNKLILNSAQGTSAACCRRSHILDAVQFVDGCKELGYQEESMYGQFLETFLNNPTLAAACLAYGDKLGLETTADVAHCIVLGCYGNNIMTDDHKHLLELMETLMLLQLTAEDQPRRLIIKGNCAFTVVLRLFMESLPLGKLFLAFALNKPVMEVLMDDEMLLETNPQKLLTQLSSYEIERRFGVPEKPEFQEKIKEHIKNAEAQLSRICSNFIDNIFSAMSCFPQSLGWIIAKSYQIVKDAGNVSKEEARALCADIFLQQFVCPAIVNPELYGVTGDVPVSDVSRSNLMQIAQVLQVMAHLDESSQKLDSVYSQLKTEPMQLLIDAVINSCSSDNVPTSHKSPLGYANSAIFFTPFQLAQLIQFLQDIRKSEVRGVDQSTLNEILSHLPAQAPQCIERALSSTPATSPDEEGLHRNTAIKSGHLTPSGGSSGDLVDLSGPSPSKKSLAKNGKSKKLIRKDDNDVTADDNISAGDVGGYLDAANEVVLVISLNSLAGNTQELLGILTENEVMEIHNRQNSSNLNVENASLDARSLTETEGLEKRSRFSLYSGGSDLSEIDEQLPTEDGLSRTSGSSSIDIDPNVEVPPDDTSSFHAVSIPAENQDEDEEEGVDLGSVSRANNDEALKALRRKLPTSRGESIEDKMRKFEIRQELGVRFADPGVMGEPRTSGQQGGAGPDTRSETWSIDAYASDSEPQTEQESQSERLREFAEDNSQPIRSASNPNSFLLLQRDEDSRSDVWSVEVLPSDSEPPDVQSDDRLRELEAEAASAGSLQPNEDVLEENRSRASTPGLSAASGFSGVSALSAVSELNQVKVGEDPWTNFGKAPSSISPDADDLLQMTKIDSGSAGSHSTGSDGRGSAKLQESAFGKSQKQSPPVIAKVPKKVASSNPSLLELDDSRKPNEIVQPLPKPSAVNKTVAWNVSDGSTSSVETPRTATNSDLALMDFDANMSTIKRSPYKHQGQTDNEADSQSTLQSESLIAWDEKPLQIKHDGDATADFGDNSDSNILKSFDPLLNVNAKNKDGLRSNEVVKASETPMKNSTPGTRSPVTLPTANGGLDMSFNKMDSASKLNSLPRSENGSEKLSPQSDSAKCNHQDSSDSPSSTRRGIDRKKPWWKSFSKRKGPSKLSSVMTTLDGSPVHGDPSRQRIQNDVNSLSSDNSSIPEKKSTADEATTSPVDDIMQKYMEKASQSSRGRTDGSAVEAEGPANKRNAEIGDSIEVNRSSSESTNPVLSCPTISFDEKSTNSGDASPSVPYISGGWNGDSPHSAAEATDCAMKSGEAAIKSDSALKEEAKRKLRIVLSMAEPLPEYPSVDLLLLGISSSSANLGYSSQSRTLQLGGKVKLREHLLSFLRAQHAEALTLLNHSRVAQIDEVIRCVESLDDQACKYVVKTLWREYKQRSSYVAYLVRSRQHLLAALSYLRHVTECTERDKAISRRYFTAQCVRMFLKQEERSLNNFRNQFFRCMTPDEKVTLVRRYLSFLYGHMVESPIWEGASEEQLHEGETCIERYVFSCVHKVAMFPNGDGDLMRDQLFSDHISRLSAVVTPTHPSLQINPKYMLECPWPSAQREVSALAAFRSPRGKLQAALRCCRAVMHLLKLADESHAPAADDFTPVLVFVLIKANPPHLLSTVQYVDHYIGDQLGGEDAYWWMQFSAATLFMKTIDERK